MKDLVIIGTITRDLIEENKGVTVGFGGSPFFALELRKSIISPFYIVANVGKDFPEKLTDEGVFLRNKLANQHSKTTTIHIWPGSEGTPAVVENFTGRINVPTINYSTVVISTLFQEVSRTSIKSLKLNNNLLLLDIQGFMREKFKKNIELIDAKKRTPQKFGELCKLVDVLKLNEGEFDNLFQGMTEKEKLSKIHSYGVKHIIITMGEMGCKYSDGKDIKKFIANKKESKNFVGAGDKFLILLGDCLNMGSDVEQAIIKTQAKLLKVL